MPSAIVLSRSKRFSLTLCLCAITDGQLCWSNASLIAHITARVKQQLRANPQATIISVSQNDVSRTRQAPRVAQPQSWSLNHILHDSSQNGLYCKSKAEAAINAEEGTLGGAMFRAINEIAEAIEDEFPSAVVSTLAYHWSVKPPKLTRPRKNVVIRLCDITANFAAPITDP